MSLRPAALRALVLSDPKDKVEATRALHADWHRGALQLDAQLDIAEPPGLPGRPARPRLVPVAQVPRRSPATPAGRAALLHAVAHIEFNAINLALDAIWRFADMPQAYYVDWLQVAFEEAHHFTLLAEHLERLDSHYGDVDAHDGLWQMTCATRHDLKARMALVPRTLEARGLDATPPMQARLRQVGDHQAAAILQVILDDEVGHVAIGNRWFRWLCERDGETAESAYPALAARYRAPTPKPPFNLEARRQAGFSEQELASLGAKNDQRTADTSSAG